MSDTEGGFHKVTRDGNKIFRLSAKNVRWGLKCKDVVNYLEEQRTGKTTAPGVQMNPDWTEWLMGYPQGWTDTRKDKLKPHPGFAEEPKGLSRMKQKDAQTKNRTRAIGNSILPQIATLLGEALIILEQEKNR